MVSRRDNAKNFGDKKGQPISRSDAARGGHNGSQTRMKRKAMHEVIKMYLDKPITDPKRLHDLEESGYMLEGVPTEGDYYIMCVIRESCKKGRMDDLKTVMELIGEMENTLTLKGNLTLEDYLRGLGGND